MAPKTAPTQRSLYAWEIQEARRIFGSRLRYDQVRIHEYTTWPNIPYRINLRLRHQPDDKEALNAITLGNHLYFPIRLLEEPVPPEHPDFYKLPWLIHEMTHAWQFQHLGWGYLFSALKSQIRLGAKAYNFGGVDGLRASYNLGQRLTDFNLEQQADIVRSYYTRLAQNIEVSEWLPFIQEIQEWIDGGDSDSAQ
jgi:hypothetical protein